MPLGDSHAETVIADMVNAVIPTEPLPFTQREKLREALRSVYELGASKHA